MIIQLKIGTRGEIVIPKKIRESMGFERDKIILLEMKDKIIQLHQAETDIVKECEERAKRANVDVSKWIYGDKLYEEIF